MEVLLEDGAAVVAFDFSAPDEEVFFLSIGEGVGDGAEVSDAVEPKKDAVFVWAADGSGFDEAGVVADSFDVAEGLGGFEGLGEVPHEVAEVVEVARFFDHRELAKAAGFRGEVEGGFEAIAVSDAGEDVFLIELGEAGKFT